ncbi:MAG TPA: T9SS type A sorting domain-containing protein, partial [Ignavibacteria bacterium]|nr:T9SS type A sorting domain-containing protein [Ignavibacteria bacterium]
VQNSYEFTGANDSNYIILKYKIKNTNSTAISNLYAGIFSFFSPNAIFNSGNITRYLASSKLGYTYNTTTPNPYMGVALMTENPANFKAIPSSEILNGFTTAEKWASLSGGIVNDSIGPGGNSFTLAAGPFNIAAGQEITVGFAVIAGNSLNDLVNIANIAKNKYISSISVKNISTEVPSRFELMQNYPNPFNPATTIKFALPKSEFVRIRIYDILGKEVATLVNEQLQAGYFEYNFNASNLSSGMYFYKIDAGVYSDIKKMVLVK